MWDAETPNMLPLCCQLHEKHSGTDVCKASQIFTIFILSHIAFIYSHESTVDASLYFSL